MAKQHVQRWLAGLSVGALACALLVAGAGPAAATPGSTTLVSLDASGVPFEGAAGPAISGDGNVVVFQAAGHLWARNRTAGTTERVDVLPSGTGSPDGGYDVSADGRYVAFGEIWYDGTHCTAPPHERIAVWAGRVRAVRDPATRFSDPFNCLAVLRRDLQDNVTELVSTSDGTARGNGASQGPTISADGNRIAFDSTATDLTAQAGDPNGSVYVRDVAAETTVLASVNSNEQVADSYSQNSRISANGELVVFGTGATNLVVTDPLPDVRMFIRNLETGETWPVDTALNGWVPVAINGDATRAAVVTTQTLMHEQDPEDTDSTLYVIERTAEDGGDKFKPSEGQATNAVALHMSPDGRYLGAVLGSQDQVRVWDLQELDDDVESVRSDGTPVEAFSSLARMLSDDGRFVAFGSQVDDVTPDAVDNSSEVFVHDRATPTQNATGTGSASTDSGSGATIDDPMTVGVSGSPGEVVIEEGAPGSALYSGYAVLGQAVQVTSPSAVPPAYLTFTFDIDVTAVPSGGDPSGVDVLRNGVALTDCSTASDPGPCVSSRSVLPSGDWRFVAHSPQASTWAVATPIGAGPPAPDTTDPTVDLRTPVSGATYQQNQAVTVDYDCADTGGVGVFSCVGTQADGASLDTSTPGSKSFSVTATDNAGNDSTSTVSYTVQAVQTDTVKPTITLTRPVQGASYTLGYTVKAAFSCVDTGGSGLASCVGTKANGANLDTSAIGTKSFTVTARDGAGNTTTKTVSYKVIWPLAAFYGPVDNLPVINTVKAGKVVPVKFSLGAYRGGSGAIFAEWLPEGVDGGLPQPCADRPDRDHPRQQLTRAAVLRRRLHLRLRDVEVVGFRQHLPGAHRAVRRRAGAERALQAVLRIVGGRVPRACERCIETR